MAGVQMSNIIDEDGGQISYVPLPGLRDKLWRYLGIKFNRDDWYKRGCRRIDHARIVKALNKLSKHNRHVI